MVPSPPEAVPHAPEFAYVEGLLQWHGHDLRALATRLSTPLFLFSETALAGNVGAIRDGFRDVGLDAVIRYCAKTNCELGVLEILARAGTDVLVSNPDEGEIAIRAGFAPGSLAFQKPILTEADSRWLISKGVGLVHVGSRDDVERLDRAAAGSQARVAVSIRIRDDLAFGLSPLGFATRRLGVASRDAAPLARRIAGSEWLDLRALNCYIGTQQTGTAKFGRIVDRLCGIVKALERDGIRIDELNLGGGIPNPGQGGRLTSSGAEAIGAFVRSLGTKFRDSIRRHAIRESPRIAVEPGRSVVGNAGLLLSRVDAVQGRWLFLDASRNFLVESPLFLRRRMLPLVQPGNPARQLYYISGRTLNTLDVIDPVRRLSRMQEGDLLAIADAGAYTLGRASRYAGLTPAAWLLRTTGEPVAMRRPETFEDVLQPMHSISDGS